MYILLYSCLKTHIHSFYTNTRSVHTNCTAVHLLKYSNTHANLVFAQLYVFHTCTTHTHLLHVCSWLHTVVHMLNSLFSPDRFSVDWMEHPNVSEQRVSEPNTGNKADVSQDSIAKSVIETILSRGKGSSPMKLFIICPWLPFAIVLTVTMWPSILYWSAVLGKTSRALFQRGDVNSGWTLCGTHK